MAYRDLARLSTFVNEMKKVLVASVVEMLAAQLGNSTNAYSSVNQYGNDTLVAEPNQVVGFDRLLQVPRLLDCDLRRLAFKDRIAFGAD